MTTKEKIVRAAAAVFAQRGYRAATIREICRRARVNVAAVNYHFGGKRALYGQMFEYLFKKTEAQDLLVTPPTGGGQAIWRQFLRAWVRRMVEVSTRPSRLEELKQRLLCREMQDPSEIFPELFAIYMVPRIAVLNRGFAATLPGKPSEQTLLIHSFSMLAQAIFYFQCRPLIDMARSGKGFPDQDIEEIAEIIARNVLWESTRS
jgi:AcrR family transcriptional regulator